MAAPFIYVIIGSMWLLFLLGIYMKNYPITALASMLMLIVGIYIIRYGLSDVMNFVTDTLGIMQVMIGSYVIIRGGIELIDESGI